MLRFRVFMPVSSLALVLLVASTMRANPPAEEFFEKEVRPLLVDHCLKCHGDTKPKGGLRLTSRTAILKGGDTGPAVVVGKPDDSLLIQAVRYNDTPQMPPKRKLEDRQIAVLTRWVKLGLPWPETASNRTVVGGQGEFHITEEQRRFWSFQPIQAVPPPAVRDATWRERTSIASSSPRWRRKDCVRQNRQISARCCVAPRSI